MANITRIPAGDKVSMGTCAITKFVVTPSGTTGKFNMEEGKYRCKTVSSGGESLVVELTISEVVDGDIDNIATQLSTLLYIDTTDPDDPLKQRFLPLSEEELRTLIPLSEIVHLDGVNIDQAEPVIALGTSLVNQVHDRYISTPLASTSGDEAAPKAGLMQWLKVMGIAQALGRNADNPDGLLNPNSPELDATDPIVFTLALGATGTAIVFGSSATINPNLWDDGSGSAIAIANPAEASIARWYKYADNKYIFMLGQQTYATYAAAQAAEGSEVFVVPPILGTALHVYSVIMDKTATDSDDILEVDLRRKF